MYDDVYLRVDVMNVWGAVFCIYTVMRWRRGGDGREGVLLVCVNLLQCSKYRTVCFNICVIRVYIFSVDFLYVIAF
jgi:hypothetical protein